MHPFDAPRELIDRITERRGRRHAFEAIEPRKTALLVIDMQKTFMEPGAPSEVPLARAIVPNINRLARSLREAGGVVAFSLATFPDEPAGGWSAFFDHMVGPEVARAILKGLRAGAPGHALWGELEAGDDDYLFDKCRYSAFARGASGIEEYLVERGIDTVIVVGTMTNLCCESTARDAMQNGFKTIMVSDANAARGDEEHRATLITFMTSFGDVRTTDEVLALIAAAPAPEPSRAIGR